MDRTISSLENTILLALQRYSNVHRGTGQHSLISTELYERSRDTVLKNLGLGQDHAVIFCSPWRLERLVSQIRPKAKTTVVSSNDFGLPFGIRALVVPKCDLPKGVPLQPGGGTVQMVSPGFVSWAGVPERFEAGTPNIIGALALARMLQLSAFSEKVNHYSRNDSALTPEQVLYEDGLAGLKDTGLLDQLRKMVVGGETNIPTSIGNQHYTNLDNGASTPTFLPVWQVVCKTLCQVPETLRGIIRTVRSASHRFFGAPESEYELFFASNTTEAMHIAAEGLRQIATENPGTVVLNTMLEHNSNELVWRFMPGITLERLPVDHEGFISLPELESMLRTYNQECRFGAARIRLVCLCGASNVMGTYNNLSAVSAVVHRYNAKLLVDAAQLAAHRPVRMAADGIDLLAFSAHKMYAPFGSGGLIAQKGSLKLDSKARDSIVSSGEENVVGIAALGKAIDLLERIGMDVVHNEENRLTRYALKRLSGVRGLKIFGIASERHERFDSKGCVLIFEHKRVPHNLMAKLLAEHSGIGVRSGCFCVNMYVKKLLGIGKMKNALAHAGLTLAPGIMKPLLIGLVRVSFGITNRESDIDRLVESLEKISHQRVGLMNNLLARYHFGTPLLPKTSTGMKIDTLVDNVVNRAFAPALDAKKQDP